MPDQLLNLEADIAMEAERRAADQLRTVQNLLDKAAASQGLSVNDCEKLGRLALAMHERLKARADQLKHARALADFASAAPVIKPVE